MKLALLDFVKNAETVLLLGEQFLVLDDPNYFYLIEEGALDLYGVQTDIKDKNNRVFINIFEEGELVFNNSKQDKTQLVLHTNTPAVLKKVPVKDFSFSQEDPAITQCIIDFLEHWIIKIGDTSRKHVKRLAEISIAPGQRMIIPKDRIFSLNYDLASRKTNKVIWIKIEKGSLVINGDEQVVLGVQDGSFPVPKHFNLTAIEDVELTIKTTGDVLKSENVWVCLEKFQDMLIRILELEKEVRTKSSKLQILSDIALEKRLIDESCNALASVLSTSEPLSIMGSGDPILKACQLIGKELQVTVNPMNLSVDLDTDKEKITEICEKCHMSFRQVKLSADHFEQDCGPLLAYYKDSKDPIVILPISATKYITINTATGEEGPLDITHFDKFSGEGYTFYKELPDPPKGFKLFKFVFEKRYLDILTVLGVSIFSAVISLYSPLAMGWIFDKAVPNHNNKFLYQLCVGLVMVGVGSAMCSLTRSFAMLRLEGKLSNKMQSAMWSRLLRLRLPFFRKYSAGDLYQRISAVDEIRTILGAHTLNTLISSFFSILYFGVMLYRSPMLSVVMLVPIFMTLFIYVIVVAMTIKRELTILNTQADIYGFFVQIVDAIKKIRVLNAENRAFSKWAEMFAKKKKVELELMAIHNWLTVSHTGITSIGSLMMYFMVMMFLQKAMETHTMGVSQMTQIGEFLSFSAAYGAFAGSIYAVGGAILSVLTDIIPRWQRAKYVLEEEPEIRNLDFRSVKIHGNISLEKVNFRYNERMPMFLKNIDIKIKEGSFIAFIGESGSGKSTLVRLLLGFEQPTSGRICYDEKELNYFDITSLRRQVGAVLQHGAILGGTFRDNITCSRSFTDKEIMDVLELCCLRDDLEHLPMRLETIFPAGGGTLSQGQRQKILIARALIGRPNVLILDDVMGALDEQTQEKIKKNLDDQNVTRIIISPKVSTIANADCIYVLEHGMITQCGNYEQLIAQEGFFKKLVKNQSQG